MGTGFWVSQNSTWNRDGKGSCSQERPSSQYGSNTDYCRDHTWLLKQKFLLPRTFLCFYQLFSSHWLLFQVFEKNKWCHGREKKTHYLCSGADCSSPVSAFLTSVAKWQCLRQDKSPTLGAFAATDRDNYRKGVKSVWGEHHAQQICFLLTGGDKPHNLLLETLGLLLKGTLVKYWRYFCAATLSILSFKGSMVAFGINALCSFGPVWPSIREAGKPNPECALAQIFRGRKNCHFSLEFCCGKEKRKVLWASVPFTSLWQPELLVIDRLVPRAVWPYLGIGALF